jgi:hypothetical protein
MIASSLVVSLNSTNEGEEREEKRQVFGRGFLSLLFRKNGLAFAPLRAEKEDPSFHTTMLLLCWWQRGL